MRCLAPYETRACAASFRRCRYLPSGEDPRKLVPELKFPVVVKARRLPGSRGVIRANDSGTTYRLMNWGSHVVQWSVIS